VATINGNSGNDHLVGSDTADSINGFGGDDILEGRAGNDQLRGDVGDDVLVGGAGSDMLNGGPGADSMQGGSGDDTYVITSGADTVSETSAANGIDLVKSSVAYLLGAHLENLTLIGGADIDGTGNGLANRITGNDGDNELSGAGGNDVLDGGRGSDVLRGGTGNDQYYINSLVDQIVEAAGGGTDTVYTSTPYLSWAKYTLPDEVENVVARGVADAGAVGNALDNLMKGNSGHNIFRGEGGNDTLVGNSGDDSLDGGDGMDTLLGGDGDDYLAGGPHYRAHDNLQDVMRGGAGDDFYEVDATDDILESAGGGIDTVRTSATSYTLPDHFEHLQLNLGEFAASVVGNAEDNIITGNGGDNDVRGLGGNDVIQGRGGLDVLRGGAGDDRLTGHHFQDDEKTDVLFGEDGADILFGATMNGGAGEDRFRVKDVVHTIEDFVSADDRIDLSWNLFFVYNYYGDRSELLDRGPLPASSFAIGAPQDGDDYVVYDPNTGTLFIDPDGNGDDEAFAIAILVGAPTLTAADMFVVGSNTW
jgi:Ca2+-binding RTX toxin-like protein